MMRQFEHPQQSLFDQGEPRVTSWRPHKRPELETLVKSCCSKDRDSAGKRGDRQ